MKNKIIILLTVLCTISCLAKKKALIIAVGNYPAKTGWRTINSNNDVPLIKNTLLLQGFNEPDIKILMDEQATKKGILDAFDSLLLEIKAGDIIVIHFSGHGQQIFDDNGDEVDNKDEAIIPYDAFVKYTFNYKGENHLRDDELGSIMLNVRNKIGKTGQLLLLLDCCHSGTATRGGVSRGGEPVFAPPGWKSKSNDQQMGSDQFEEEKLSENSAPFVLISGASANEINYEYEGHGSLSLSFAKAMNEVGSKFTYRQLFSKIAANMNIISPKQTPVIEGDMDYLLFNNDYVKQIPFFEITRIENSKSVFINAGLLNRIFENTTVYILPAGQRQIDKSKILAHGKVLKSDFNESTIELDRALPDTNAKSYWVFIDQPSYGHMAIKLFIDESVTEKSIRDGITSFLQKNKLGEIGKTITNSEFALSVDRNDYVLKSTNGMVVIANLAAKYDKNAVDKIGEHIFNFVQGKYLQSLTLKDSDYEFEFKLIPVRKKNSGALEFLNSSDYTNSKGIFEVNTSTDKVILQVTNKSERPIYFSIIEINSQGEIASFFPNPRCPSSDDDRLIPPGKTINITSCTFSFSPPFERLILKGFATATPINFEPTVTSRGQDNDNEKENPLERFIKKSYHKNRSLNGTEDNASLKGYSAEFVYDIVKK